MAWSEIVECESQEAFEEYYKHLVHVHFGNTKKTVIPTDGPSGRTACSTIGEDFAIVDWYKLT